MDKLCGRMLKNRLKRVLVSLIIGPDAREREAKGASNGVDVAARVGLGKAVLLGRGEAPGSEGSRVLARPFDAHAGNAEVDKVRAVRSGHNIVGGDVAVDDAVPVKLLRGLAKLDAERDGGLRRQRPIGFDNFGKRSARNEVVNDNKVLGQLIGRLDAGEAGRVAFGKCRPYIAAGKFLPNLFSHEGTGSVDCDEFGDAVFATREHLLDAIGVVEAHGVHELVVVQAVLPSC